MPQALAAAVLAERQASKAAARGELPVRHLVSMWVTSIGSSHAARAASATARSEKRYAGPPSGTDQHHDGDGQRRQRGSPLRCRERALHCVSATCQTVKPSTTGVGM